MALAAMLAGLAPAAGRAQETEIVHDCQATQSGAFGTLTVTSSVAADGRRLHYRMHWISSWRSQGVVLGLVWEGPAFVGPPDLTPTAIQFATGRRGAHPARLELSRSIAASSGPYELAMTTSFQPQARGGVDGSVPWGDLRRLMQGVDALYVIAIEQRRGPVAQDRIEAAWLGWPAAAIEAVRAELAEVEGDFRNRCPVHVHDPAEDI